MERRLLLAISLMIVVAVLPSLFIKPQPRRPTPQRPTPAARDSAATGPAPQAVAPALAPAARAPVEPVAAPVRGDTAAVATPRARYRFNTVGAALESAQFPGFRSFNGPGPVDLVRPGDRFLTYRVVVGADTLRFDSVAFGMARSGEAVSFSGARGPVQFNVAYARTTGRNYQLDITGTIEGLEGRGALLLVGLGSGLANVEADSLDNYRRYGVVGRRVAPEEKSFQKVAAGETAVLEGPFDWVAVKSKYFIAALLSSDSTQREFGGAVMVGGPRTGRTATHAQAWVTRAVGADGRFRFSLFLGPQEYRELRALGRQLDKASPYGWIFKPIVMPVAVWITQLLLWMHEHLRLGYGLVLVLFGILVRVLLWPLNQKAMRSSVAMQAVQPLMKEIQVRHKDDPQRLQQETMKLYKEHKVNPLGGCLPMLLPFPVLLALFFVFANTIEFRGVPFLWLPDLSLRDPYYIIPVVMGASMWALSKLGQKGMPPNPQAKMMTTVMPIMMTVMFVNFASGLNLYYAVSNLVSLPQQYLINQARQRELEKRKGKS
ncbi:MAG: membrane protein insertase YidC [Gemmatimonadota bacterium]